MGKSIKGNIARAKTFHETFRYIDDFCALVDGGDFQKSCKEIYPKELACKVRTFRLLRCFS